VQDVAIGNYYLRNIFSEAWLSRWGVIGCARCWCHVDAGIFMSPGFEF